MRSSRHPASPQVTCNKQFSIQQFLSMPFYARSTPSKFHRRICRYRPFIIQPPVSSIPTSAFGNPVRHPVLRSSTTSCHSYFKSLDTTLQSGFINPARLSGCGERQHYPTLSNPPPFSYVFNLTSNSASHLSYSGWRTSLIRWGSIWWRRAWWESWNHPRIFHQPLSWHTILHFTCGRSLFSKSSLLEWKWAQVLERMCIFGRYLFSSRRGDKFANGVFRDRKRC